MKHEIIINSNQREINDLKLNDAKNKREDFINSKLHDKLEIIYDMLIHADNMDHHHHLISKSRC